MNAKAKQLIPIDFHSMDGTTALGFFGQIRDRMAPDTTLTAAMGTEWTNFTASLQDYDDAYAQVKKWAQTDEMKTLDDERDDALSAYLQTLKAMTKSPNAAKQQDAKALMFIRNKYTLRPSDEYMKETTAISQMVQEMEASAEAQAALQVTGLDDWFQDLKVKNANFLVKMNERTEAQAGLQKGILREKRQACEAAYRDVVKVINAMAICELPAGYSLNAIIDLLNAEIEHYRQILARKGGGSSSGGGGGNNNEDNGGGSDDQGGSDTPGED